MKRVELQSNNLKSMGYDDENAILEIEFTNGMIYQYNKVPHTVKFGLLTASSAGKYFHKNIKNNFTFKIVG